ncbi:MAG: ABC transporter permease, partial [Lachnospiraceae bacterium]|nr:ABC transporter permease [Lachnospiraceae bacterium]
LYDKIEHEEIMFFDGDQITFPDGKKTNFLNTAIVESVDTLKTKFFDEDNKELKEVKKGEIYVVKKMLDNTDIKVGDTLVFTAGDTKMSFKVAGTVKDAVLGSTLMGNERVVLNDEDAGPLYEAAKKIGWTGKMYYFHTDHAEELQNKLNELDASFTFLGTREFIKSSYIMDMVVAILLLVVSVILIIVALIVLRFTISFTMTSEFREIGVMKAIGISNMKIRLLYLAKYLAISIVGAIIGTLLSFPFGNLMINVSGTSIMIESQNGVLISILCAIAVVLIIMLFGLLCTRKANKLSPVDAIRNGQTGERYRKKGFLHLSKSRMSSTTFMAGNDVLSAPKRYLIIIVVFALSILPIQFLDITASSLGTKEMLTNLGCLASDACFFMVGDDWMYTTDGSGHEKLLETINDIEKKLEDNGMPGRVYTEIMLAAKQEFNGKTTKVLAVQGVNNRADEHKYTKGSAPKNKNEVAIMPNTAKTLGADIGDTIKVTIGNDSYDLMISGFFEAMLNKGEGIRIHEDLYADYNHSNGSFGLQLDFDDNPNEKEVNKRLEKLEEILPECKDFHTGAKQAENITSVGPMFTTIKKIFLILSIAIVIMVAVLMERSMVIKETAEIATLKAIGFTDGKVVKWHSKRFIITAVISAVIAGTLALPITRLAAGPIFSFMGVSQGVSYSFNVPRVCVFYPILVMCFMTLSIWITASCTRKITAQQTSCTE